MCEERDSNFIKKVVPGAFKINKFPCNVAVSSVVFHVELT